MSPSNSISPPEAEAVPGPAGPESVVAVSKAAQLLIQFWRVAVIFLLGWSVVSKAVTPKHLRAALRFDGFPESFIPQIMLGLVAAEISVIALLVVAPRGRLAPLAVTGLFSVFTGQLIVFLLAPGKYPGFCGCGLPTIWDGRAGLMVGVVRNLLVLGGAYWALRCHGRSGQGPNRRDG